MSDRGGGVGVQQSGGHGQAGHGGFAAAGGGGGGGKRPRGDGDGPAGHRWEDTRHEGRVQKNTGARGGRGRGRGRGGQQAANEQHTWSSGQTFQKRETGPQEHPEGVNYDSLMNKRRSHSAPSIRDGILAVEGSQRDRLMQSQAKQYEAADIEAGSFLGINLTARNAQSLLARADRTQPSGTTYNVRFQRVSKEDGAASSDEIKYRFLTSLVAPADPFAFDQSLAGRMEVDDPPISSADKAMEAQMRKDAAEGMDYAEHDDHFKDDPGFYEDM